LGNTQAPAQVTNGFGCLEPSDGSESHITYFNEARRQCDITGMVSRPVHARSLVGTTTIKNSLRCDKQRGVTGIVGGYPRCVQPEGEANALEGGWSVRCAHRRTARRLTYSNLSYTEADPPCLNLTFAVLVTSEMVSRPARA
jgi:hypothetical protein